MSFRSKFVAVLASCLGLCLILETAVAQTNRQDSTRLPDRNLLGRMNLERAWWNQATINKTEETIRYITADEDLLYIQTSGGLVTAFDAEKGKMKWSLQLGSRNDPSVPVASNKKMAVISVGVMLFGIEKSSGELLWKVKTPQPATASPTMDEKQLYLGTLDGTVIAFDIDKIQELHEKGKLPAWSFQAIVWRFKTGRNISSPPLSNGKTVSFGCSNGSLYTTNASDGKLIFQFETDDPISAPLSEKGDRIFLVSEDAKIYCLDRNRGFTLWTYSVGLPIRNKALVFGQDLLVFPTRGGLQCLGILEGNSKWPPLPKLSAFVAASAKHIYASDDLGNLVAVSRKDGVLKGSIPLRQYPHRAVNDRTDRIFLATPSGLVIALKEKGSAKPLMHKKPEEDPGLPGDAKSGKAKNKQVKSQPIPDK